VGITDRTLEYRWCKHVIASQNGSEYHFHRAIHKHGDDAFEGFVLEECASVEELKAAERRWIQLLATNLPQHGYNMTRGGDGVFGLRMTDESRQKMRESHLGKQHTLEQRQKISATMKRRYEDPSERQRTSASLMKDEVRKKMSENGKGKNLGRVVSAETRRKISEGHQRRRLNKGTEQSTV
jgi:group I intron endonuclease